MNLAQRARKATSLSQRAFATLLGVSRSQVTRWETGSMKPSAAAESLLLVTAACPREVIAALETARGAEGYTGDGGPPPLPKRPGGGGRGAEVDEHGFAAEPELGFEEGDLSVPGYSPDFGFDGAQEEPGYDPGSH